MTLTFLEARNILDHRCKSYSNSRRAYKVVYYKANTCLITSSPSVGQYQLIRTYVCPVSSQAFSTHILICIQSLPRLDIQFYVPISEPSGRGSTCAAGLSEHTLVHAGCPSASFCL